ncbi:DUF1830 domain-containing protein [Cyanobium sp. CH-040]|uniref:DUF1830 domain-containing protein n=1 Tax=Cyanobium sp. CH-040 TaxID=2823708 RepID=UPI0037C0A439|nr:DUF1830 domain-containing protein [Cyanobium sp. CH-040]
MTRRQPSIPDATSPDATSERSSHPAYGYRNARDVMVVLRCSGPEQFFLERVVFPFELLTFHAPPDGEVRIHGATGSGWELLEEVCLEDLQLEPVPVARHPLEQVGMRHLLNDLQQRYACDPSEENRARLVQQEQLLRRWLPGQA